MKDRLKSILIDYGFSVYIIACVFYLLYAWFEIEVSQMFMLVSSLGFGLLNMAIPNSPGKDIVYDTEYKFFNMKKYSGYLNCLVMLLTLIVGWQLVEIKPLDFFTGFQGTANILNGLFQPDGSIFYQMLGELIKTIYLALMATVFAVPVAFVFSFFAASNLMGKSIVGRSVYTVVRTFSTIIRSIEAIVWAIIFAVWVNIGPFAGMLALMTHSIAALIKLYSEQIENIDQGPVEAITSTGANTWQIWRYAVIPQIINPFLAFTIYRWDINVRMATIVGFVGGGGIGLHLFQKQQMTDWNGVGTIVWLIAFTVWIMDMISAKIRKTLLEN
jgi:phosphonate transport system permease protein